MTELKLQKKTDIHLKPGEIHFSDAPVIIKTILGSCISMVFYCKRHHISGISHAQLPGDSKDDRCQAHCPVNCGSKNKVKDVFKYVTLSTQYMLDQFSTMKIQSHEIEVKLFGGANVLQAIHSMKTVGEKNIEAAHEMVRRYHLRLTAEDTGGQKGRTLYLSPYSGEVWVFTHKR